ncbi:MAG: M14 family metallopeptidase [Gemmatimonadota bacterium]
MITPIQESTTSAQRRVRGAWLAICVLLTGGGALEAQVPSFQDVTGLAFGDRITLHHEMVGYLEALARTSDRVEMVDQGRSYEGNRLVLAIVTAPENHLRLDEIRSRAGSLGDPRTVTPQQLQTLLEAQPAVAWLGGSIHGFELSGSEGLMKLLEHLTTRSDPETLEVLRNVVVLIDPMLNPDGRDAHARHNHENIGLSPASRRDDWSNDFNGWEGSKYRTSHYYHDINRDWFAHTHPETRYRVGTLQAWRPQVLVDAHEMGPDVEFYFDPPTDPYGDYFPSFARWGFDLFNQGYSRAFDRAGFEYMTGERYNYFYPGYTTSYGSYQGAVGMLYEQGSTRGLAMTRADGSIRTLEDALNQQYTAAWSALQTTSENRRELLQRYHEAHAEAVADGGQGIRRYLVSPEDGDPHLLGELIHALQRSGVEVDRLTQATQLSGVRDRYGESVGSVTFPAGTVVVEAAQPRNRFIRTLLEPDTPLPEDFLERARAHVDRGENPRFYDITAYSLPLLFNLAGYSSADGSALPTARVEDKAGGIPFVAPPRAEYAYLLDGSNARSLSMATRLKEAGYRAAFSTVGLTVDGDELPSGTIILRVGQNPASLHDSVTELSEQMGVAVRAVDSGATDTGYPSLGSGDVFPMNTPKVALVGELPVNPLSFGYAWHTLDRQYEIPTTVLRAGSLAEADLRDFNVLVLPELASSQALEGMLGDAGLENLRRWVRQGGTLVVLGSAVEFARGALGLLRLRSWYEAEDSAGAVPYDVPGAFFRGELTRAYWLSAGVPVGSVPIHVRSSRLYLPPDAPPAGGRRVVGTFASEDPLISGHAWPETLERMGGSVWAYEERAGSGRVIAFSEDLNFRSFWRGGQRLFLNAVVFGPSAP